ncbi:ubiquinone biosynthesis accessory factor UbiK [Inmirania thermothiophila]|uniref:Ubiquinone biosynthesis accessory factor UbiK n=1 Tax=Inmirania thermothiophila TaxID=1750597 RepID=A0A3N1Y6H6_9GAMM|nr:accessory factor UbiK family protein [Inmirania thermothiophila]ROR34413.1 hypothetical protein EDC57_0309 [Inmirania thermothiophila]
MISQKTIDELAKGLAAMVPPGMRELQQDMERNFRAVLQAFFARMDLVTREEFDVQAELLARTRTMVERLERRVAALEAHAGITPPAEPPLEEGPEDPPT